MNKSNLLVFIIVALAVIGVARTTHLSGSLLNSDSKFQSSYDICVYGGNASGVIAAYAARQLGKSVILIEPSGHLGGMTASGLGATDIGNKYAITGLARDFYRRLGKHYGKLEAWTFEPHVATKVFQQYILDGQDQSHQSVDLQNNENSWADLGSFLFIPEQQPYIQVVADNLEFPAAADAVLLVAEIE